MADQVIHIQEVDIVSSPDARAWPATATITRLAIQPTGVAVDFTKKNGPNRWPDVVPPKWTGPLQYTLWLFGFIDGRWRASGIIQYWNGLDANGGDVTKDNQIATNWLYSARWRSMQGYQPKPGEQVGFMVTAGNARGQDDHAIAERSNIVVVEFPAPGVYPSWTFADTQPGESQPPQPPAQPSAQPDGVSDATRQTLLLTDISAKLDRLALTVIQQTDRVIASLNDAGKQIAAALAAGGLGAIFGRKQ